MTAPDGEAVTAPAVVVDGVTYRYPGAARPAVDGVTLAVAAGGVLGVAGENGCGKTTLARLLHGLLRPDAGSVMLDGLDTARVPVRTLADRVGSVFQNPNHQLFARTVAEELAIGPRALGLPPEEVRARAAAVVEDFGLGPLLDRHPFRIGRAQRKLVAFAAVLAMRPRILVIDEPTTAQDLRGSTLVADRIRLEAAGGTTIVLFSHDMPLLAAVADRLVVMARGALIADATPREVFADAALLDRARLEPPQVAQLAARLGSGGRSPWPPITVEEAVAAWRRPGGGR